jgi:hypothetical protein
VNGWASCDGLLDQSAHERAGLPQILASRSAIRDDLVADLAQALVSS